MKNLTLLLLTFAVFSCTPSMEDDVARSCEMVKEGLANSAATMELVAKVTAEDADAIAETAELVAALAVMAEEGEAIEERNKDNKEAFDKLFAETCK